MSGNVKLKPCPFCGGAPRRVTIRFPKLGLEPATRMHMVECPDKFCNGHFTAGFATPEAAVAAWNRRTGEGDAHA